MHPTPAKAIAGRADPKFAAYLTWFLPGAGHVYLGRPAFALAAFVLIQGLYGLGLWLADGRLFELLQVDLRAPFAGALTPEAGNLSGLVWQMTHDPFGESHPRPFPETIHLGAWLSACAGVLNACLMAHAYFAAQVPKGKQSARRSPAFEVAAGWLVPGLGHWLQGRRVRAVVVFVLLVGLLLLGTWLADGSNLNRERHFYYWGGQMLAGVPAMVLEALRGHPYVTGEILYVDCGLVFASLAGLLNALALLDVFRFGSQRALAELEDEQVTKLAEARA